MRQAAIVRNGGISLILAALRSHVGVADVAHRVCYALHEIACRDDAASVRADTVIN